MQLSNMRYKTFVWPHNPRVYSIEFERRVAVNELPFGRYALQNLGLTRRVMRGEGEFVGKDAYTTFQKLTSLFYQETAGTLVHPLWDTTQAWFVGLRLEQEPRADYVKYSFEFWEDFTGAAASLRELAEGSGAETGGTAPGGAAAGGAQNTAAECWHMVVKGESLWSIAAKYETTLSQVIALNPQIKNPNLIYVGQKVRVA